MSDTAASRDELIEDLLEPSWPDGDRDGFPTRRTAEFIADSLLAAGWVKAGDTETEWGVCRPYGDIEHHDDETLARDVIADEGAGSLVSRTVGPWRVVE